MLRVLGKLPVEKFHFACSGGSDSMVFLDFLRRYPKNRFDVLHFNHGTQYCDEAESFVKAKCAEFGIECHVGRIGRRRAKGESQEEYWRNERYAFFEKCKSLDLLPVPSDSFGCPGWIRIGYCVSYETIVNSMPAWQKLWDTYHL